MAALDFVFVIILLWAVYKGFTKGLISQLATLAALLLGIFGAVKFSGFTSDLLIKNFDLSGQYLPVISFAVTFIVIVIAVHLVAKMVDKLIEAVALGIVNRLLGVLFSVLKIAFIISIILVFINKLDNRYNFIPDETKEKSLFYEPLSRLAPMVFPYLNFDHMKNEFDQKKNDIKSINV